MMAELKAAW
jgi:hypothetical protein